VPQLAPLQPAPESDQLKTVLGFESGTGVRVAAMVADPPKATFGETVTLTEAAGGGVGGGRGVEEEAVVTLPQPCMRTMTKKIASNEVARIVREEIFAGSMARVSGRGHMRRGIAGEGPAKGEGEDSGRQVWGGDKD
jgi:hypothetical protein